MHASGYTVTNNFIKWKMMLGISLLYVSELVEVKSRSSCPPVLVGIHEVKVIEPSENQTLSKTWVLYIAVNA